MPRLPNIMSLMLPGNRDRAIDEFFNACANESKDPLKIKDRLNGYSILSLAVQTANGGVVDRCLDSIKNYYGEALARSKVAALRDIYGKTPLFIAADSGNSKTGDQVIKALCAAGVDPNVQAETKVLRLNKTALHEANANTIPALLDHGADPSVCDVDGNNPLACAFINYNPGAAKAMLDYFEKKINEFGEASAALDTSQQQFLVAINRCMHPSADWFSIERLIRNTASFDGFADQFSQAINLGFGKFHFQFKLNNSQNLLKLAIKSPPRK